MEKHQFTATELVALFGQGCSVADLAGVDKKHLEALYALAYQLYQSKNFDDAASIFRALCLYDYNEIKYFMGLGGCEQALGNYKKAADIYSLASVVSDLVDPEPMYYAAVCLLKAGEKENAVAALESLSIMGKEGDAKDDTFKNKGAALLKIVSEK